jgi:hypothetical protein
VEIFVSTLIIFGGTATVGEGSLEVDGAGCSDSVTLGVGTMVSRGDFSLLYITYAEPPPITRTAIIIASIGIKPL